MPRRFFEVVNLHERFDCNRRKREASFVKCEARDGKKACLVFVCEIRDTLHEARVLASREESRS
jgi:hypothetical protein